jgi:hypothetical protein
VKYGAACSVSKRGINDPELLVVPERSFNHAPRPRLRLKADDHRPREAARRDERELTSIRADIEDRSVLVAQRRSLVLDGRSDTVTKRPAVLWNRKERPQLRRALDCQREEPARAAHLRKCKK